MLVGTSLQATVAETAAANNLAKVPASEKPLAGHGAKMLPRTSDGEPRVPKDAPKHTWAKAGSATVTLAPHTKSAATAGDLPISLTAPTPAKDKSSSANGKKTARTPWPGKATVRVLDAKTTKRAGVDGLLFTVQPHKGAAGNTAGVSVDYSSFAQAYGGAYAARLKLVQLPACAATSPGSKKCSTITPVTTSNDTKTHTLTASALSMSSTDSATATPMVLAATTATSSDHGDYKAAPRVTTAAHS